MTDTIILAFLFGLMAFFMWKMFSSRSKTQEEDIVSRPAATSIAVPQNSIVKIRHASDGLEVEVSSIEPFEGPLSDAAEDAALWERLQSGKISPEERKRIAVILREHGFHIELEAEPLPEPVQGESDVESVKTSVVTPPPEGDGAEPEAEVAPEKLSEYDLEDLQDLIIRGLRERLCTPAFALLASQEYGFSLEFEDGLMKERAADKSELAMAESYREAIRKDLAEAMRLYSEDHPEPPEPEPTQPVLDLPKYDFGKLR